MDIDGLDTGDLLMPLWSVAGVHSPLNVLQYVRLVNEFKEQTNATGRAMKHLLLLLRAGMPPTRLPKSEYLMHKIQDRVVQHTMGAPGFVCYDLCSDPHCSTVYINHLEHEDVCPEYMCGAPRWKHQQNGKKVPIRQLQYMGVERCVRTILSNQRLCQAILDFPLSEMYDSEYSVLSSELGKHLCRYHIRGWDGLSPADKRTRALRFFETGHGCTAIEWGKHLEEVQQGTTLPTVLIILEGGTDGFQPHERRIRTTWAMGYRVVNMDWRWEGSGEGEVVTALSESAVEGKACLTVTRLDAEQLVKLTPPSAGEPRASRPPTSMKMWVRDQGGDMRVKTMGVYVVCVGIQADAPMRAAVIRHVEPAALRGCDCCGFVAKKKEEWGGTKYLGYLEPTEHDVYEPDQAGVWGSAKCYANGYTVSRTGERIFGNREEPVQTTVMSSRQMVARDKEVEVVADRKRTASKNLPARLKAKTWLPNKLKELYKRYGSKGRCQFTKYGPRYWDPHLMRPVAVYHATYLGPAKDHLGWMGTRMDKTKYGPGKSKLVLAFGCPEDVHKLVMARLSHFVLRSTPDCILCDFTSLLGNMSISEVQLMWEVGIPYLIHDLHAFGVPRAVLVSTLLLRFACMTFTRLMNRGQQAQDDEEEHKRTCRGYREMLEAGQLAAFAYGCIMEYYHVKLTAGDAAFRSMQGIRQMFFTWKLHMLQHMHQQITLRGHPCQASDMFVERMVRHKASRKVKDRATTHTENAIAHAHEDHNSRTAMELFLSKAKNLGVQFCPDMSLAPSLEEACEVGENRARAAQGDNGHPARTKRRPSLKDDVEQEGELTGFQGVGTKLKVNSPDDLAAKNAIGFYLFTQCAENGNGEWPYFMGVHTTPLGQHLNRFVFHKLYVGFKLCWCVCRPCCK